MSYAEHSGELVHEHEIILKVLEALENKVNESRRAKQIDMEFMRGLLEFSRLFIDRCHHGKEEKCLFPCLERRGIPREGGPIGVMLQEHEMGRAIVRRINALLDKYEQSSVSIDEVLDSCLEYIELLRQHIYKENNILFPMGDRVSMPDDIAETLRCYAEREAELGGGEHQRLEKLAESLASRRR